MNPATLEAFFIILMFIGLGMIVFSFSKTNLPSTTELKDGIPPCPPHRWEKDGNDLYCPKCQRRV